MAEQQSFKRQTAYLCTAGQLAKGRYVRREGWEPSFMALEVGAVSRVRLAGVVVESSSAQIVVDDGSGKLALRVFDGLLPPVVVGDPVLVIGRPRVFGEEPFVLAETVRRLSSPAWLRFYAAHRQEWQSFIPPPPVTAPVEVAEEVLSQAPSRSAAVPPSAKPVSLIDLIRELDPGDGAPVDEVLAKASLPDAERRLQFLISEGEVFELRAGKVKVLE